MGFRALRTKVGRKKSSRFCGFGTNEFLDFDGLLVSDSHDVLSSQITFREYIF